MDEESLVGYALLFTQDLHRQDRHDGLQATTACLAGINTGLPPTFRFKINSIRLLPPNLHYLRTTLDLFPSGDSR